MALVGIQEPSARRARWAPLALAFRPFFILAGASAALLLALWAWAYAHGHLADNYYGYIEWHSHEMVFGYAGAVIAGFLLTAARNWTGVQTLRGFWLGALALLWLLGRLVPFMTFLPPWLVALIDLSFLPLFALALLVPLLRGQHYKSLMFVAIALGMALGNGLVHAERLGFTEGLAQRGVYLAMYMVLLIVVIMGGRVIPFFTEKTVSGFARREWRWIELSAGPSIVLLALISVLWPQPIAIALMAIVAATVHGLRLHGWYSRGIWQVPLLWVLHLGYAWLVVGLVLTAVAALGRYAPMLAVHALTIGAIGGVTLGMMARVVLGHTGRPLQPPRGLVWAFALLNLATLLRVFLPQFVPAYTLTVLLASTLWVAAFMLFTAAYLPMLLRPRVDGQAG